MVVPKVKQTRIEPTDEKAKWKLSRRQIISILEHTEPEDWLFRSVGHFDAQTDGWKHDDERWEKSHSTAYRLG